MTESINVWMESKGRLVDVVGCWEVIVGGSSCGGRDDVSCNFEPTESTSFCNESNELPSAGAEFHEARLLKPIGTPSVYAVDAARRS